MCTYCELVEGPCILDVREGSLEVLQLDVNLLGRLLRLCDLLHPIHHANNGLTISNDHEDSNTRRTALDSNVSIALICALTSYETGLKSFRSFSASSTIALFFNTER